MKQYLSYILMFLFVVALSFTSCTKLEVIEPAGDVENVDFRAAEEDNDLPDEDDDEGVDGDEDGDDVDDEDEDGITDEDDDEDEDDSDTKRGVINAG